MSMALSSSPGAEALPSHWHEINDFRAMPIYGNSRRPVNWDYTVTREDGVKARFRGLDDLESLGRIIEGKIDL